MTARGFLGVLLALSTFGTACGSQPDAERTPVRPDREASTPSPSAAPAMRAHNPDAPRIIFLGDSLTAGLGLAVEDSFPSLIQERLDASGHEYEVVNAGVSGDTSAGGLRRLEWAMSEGQPEILVVALGGNDGLRGLPPRQLEQNLDAIIQRARQRGLEVILAGMEAPPNFGADYTSEFRAVYQTLAARHEIKLIPFLLEGVAGNAAYNQPDGIHPNARGAEIVADLVWDALQPEVARPRATSSR